MTGEPVGRLWSSGGSGHTRAVFTGRPGGVSQGRYATLNLGDHVGDDPAAVAANRARAVAEVGLDPQQLAVVKAAHGRDWAHAQAAGTYSGVDILLTTSPDLAVMALAADCVTIALADESAAVAAVVHSGWRGLVAGAAGAAVDAMRSFGARPARVSARLGPAICPRCYEVSRDVQDQVAQVVPEARARTSQGTPALALQSAVLAQLRGRGITDVEADPTCTAESAELFSHRRDGVTGRHGVVLRLGRP